jgi:tight adherence protein B
VLGVYWLLQGQQESRERARLWRRLRSGPRTRAAVRPDLVKQETPLSRVGPLNSLLLRASAFVAPMQRTIDQADMRLTVGVLLLSCGCLGLASGLAVAWFTHFPWIGLIVGAVAAFLPYFYVRHRASKRIYVFEEQFPEAIDLISRALRAGHAFTTGLAMVAEEAPQPVAGEFRRLYDQQNFGMPLPEALRSFAERIPLLDARFFVTAVLVQREAGGNLAEVLDNLAAVIRERFKVKRQVRVITAHARITGWVLAGLPPALTLAFLVTTPSHIWMLVNDPLGVRMIVLALTLQTIGTLIIRRLVDIEY